MRILFVFLAVLLFVSPVFGETILTLEGPVDPLPLGPGKFKVDVYGEAITDFVAVQTVLEFRDIGDVLSDDFQISETNGNPAFVNQAIWPNEAEFPIVFPVYVDDSGNSFHRQMAGFMLLAGSADLPAKTLIQTIWYDYTANVLGSYSITANFSDTVISDSFAVAIPYSVTAGSFTVVPEPATILFLGIGLVCFLVYFRKNIFPSFSPVPVKRKED